MNHSLGTTDVTQLAINQGWHDQTKFRSRNQQKGINVNISVLNPGMMLRVNSFTGNSWQVERHLFFCLDLAYFQIKVKSLRRITLVSWVERWMTNSKDNTSSLGSPTGEGNKVFWNQKSAHILSCRPGNGAPRDKSHKENLIKMLHFPENTEKVPSNVELLTLERLSVKWMQKRI